MNCTFVTDHFDFSYNYNCCPKGQNTYALGTNFKDRRCGEN